MNSQVIFFCLAVSFVFACKKKDACDDLVNGVYEFPELPANHKMTSQEVTDFWDLPEDIANCITTEGLIETCLNYPDLRLIMAGANPQSGYDLLVKERFLGIRELEERGDRGTCLLKKFQEIDPLGYDPDWESIKIGKYLFNISYIEIIFSQYVNLETLTKSEKITLIEKGIDAYNKMRKDSEHHGLFSLECTTALMGRLMYLDEYDSIVDLYNQNFQIFELLEFYGPTSFENVELVYNLSKEYLSYLKNNLS